MPDEVISKPEEKPADIFGDGAPVEPKVEEKKEEENDKGKKEEVDIDNHPVVVELRTKLNEYGTNLSGQREVIKNFENKIKELSQAKPAEKEKPDTALYKDIKRSKDLTKAEKDEMTETELRQMDAIADLQEGLNRMAAMLTEKTSAVEAKVEETEKKTEEKIEETKTETARSNAVRSLALELSEAVSGKEDKALANQIIEAFNLFDQSKIPDNKLTDFVKQAAALVPDYKPPKEQHRKNGSAVKEVGKNDDPFGVDQIVEEIHSRKDGNYSL